MITSTHSAQTAPQTMTLDTSQRSAVASDFETFLQMLTVQARNQDPLEPMDSSQYASQLAQFSMVEQQVQSNNLLSTLAAALSSVNLDELASWVGMDVRTTSAFHFDGSPVTLFSAADPDADKAVLVIRGDDDTVIDRIPVSASEAEFVWAGTGADGTPLKSGNYSATLESYNGDKLLSENPVAAYNRVVEAQVGDDTVLLTLEGGTVISVPEVSAIRTGA